MTVLTINWLFVKSRKHISAKCLKRPCSQYPNLSTACPQTCNHKSWKELWLLWTRFGPFHVLCATPGLGSQAPPECVSCKNSINEEWLLQLQLVQCLSAGPAAEARSARARQARRAPKSAGLDWCKLIIVTKWARHDAFYDYIPTYYLLPTTTTYILCTAPIHPRDSQKCFPENILLWGIFCNSSRNLT